MTKEHLSKFKEMPEESEAIGYSRAFSTLEFEKLKLGLSAGSMDEKWNAYYSNNIFSMHRSWTGACIYEFQLREENGIYSVENARVNRNQEQYKATDNDYDVLLLDFLISNLILGESKPFPSRTASSVPKGIEQHSVSGTGYKEIKFSKRPWWRFW